jgi:hypothetical protein
MKIGYIGDSAYRTVLEHTNNITLNINEDTQAVLVEDPSIGGTIDLNVLNTSPAISNIMSDRGNKEKFYALHSIVDAHPVSYISGFMGREELSPMIEVAYSTRMLTGGIGAHAGKVQGTAIPVNMDNLHEAVPGLSILVESLQLLGYRGNIAFGTSSDFRICRLVLGHDTMFFALYNELATKTLDDYYEACLTGGFPELHMNALAVATLVSSPPYPFIEMASNIKAPPPAEKHLYREQRGLAEIGFVCCWGLDAHEAKRRVRRTLEKISSYEKEVQYRTDYGWKETFMLSSQRWHDLGGIYSRQN